MSRLSVSIDISPANMNGSRLGACCTKADGARINGGRIKAVGTENCHIDIVGAVGIDSDLHRCVVERRRKPASFPELNRPDIAYADTEIS